MAWITIEAYEDWPVYSIEEADATARGAIEVDDAALARWQAANVAYSAAQRELAALRNPARRGDTGAGAG